MSDDKLALAIQHVHDMLDNGWTAAAISKASGVNQITLGNIKNRKATRITDKVYQRIAEMKAKVDAGQLEPPKRGRKSASKMVTKTPAAAASRSKSVEKPDEKPAPRPGARGPKPAPRAAKSSEGMINTNYVPVDIRQLQGVIDRLIDNFSAAITELESIKKQLK